MKEGIYILCLIIIVVVVGFLAGNIQDDIDRNTPIKSSVIQEPIIQEKEYEKYEMGNYR